MRHEIRTSLPSRLVALSFIVMVLLANLWFVDRLTGQAPPLWMERTFLVSLGGVVVGGLGIAYLSLRHTLGGARNDERLGKDD